MNIFGLDIGSTSIKIAQVAREGAKFRLISVGIAPTPQPGLKSEAETDLIALATAIKKLHQDTKITTKNVVVALPEGQIFTRVIELPSMNENELAQAVPWEAEQFVPMPLSEVTLDWQVVSRGTPGKVEEKIKVFLAAAPTTLVEKYVKILEMAGFSVAAVETEIIAASRALISSSAPPTLLINLGAKSTDLATVVKGQVVLTRSIPTAGEALTRAIATTLSLEVPQAEEYKIAYGLGENELEGKIKKAITPVFELVVSEVKKALFSWREKESETISSIILAGGTATLPQAGAFLTKQLGIEVQIADPFSQLVTTPSVIASLREKAPLFAVAVGLAEKEV
ncbi:MAG: type IV pilus assembly protein PilM [Patescibacteria group bacterium]